MRVTFLHPDLGIGGAERLIVLLALKLQERGHQVRIYTSSYDKNRCFSECKALDICVYGSWIPRSLFGSFTLVFALIKAIWLCLALRLLSWATKEVHDVFVIDQLAAYTLMLPPYAKVFYYCHFPDKLLVRGHQSILKKLYRKPLNALEEYATKRADIVAVNSRFTRQIMLQEFPSAVATLRRKASHRASALKGGRRNSQFGIVDDPLPVIYPGIQIADRTQAQAVAVEDLPLAKMLSKTRPWFASLNRFERKKQIEIAIHAYHDAVLQVRGSRRTSLPSLIVAGGYDTRLQENIQVLSELRRLAETLGLSTAILSPASRQFGEDSSGGIQVFFIPNASDAEVNFIIQSSVAVLYTPQNEHFGIVPLEAMSRGKPVVAWDNGGPVETVQQGVTGLLCPSSEEWGRAVKSLIDEASGRSRWNEPHIKDYVMQHFDIKYTVDQVERLLEILTN